MTRRAPARARQIKLMLDHHDSPYIRCLGFLYLRIAMSDGYKELWEWFEPYLRDPEEFNIDGTPQTKTTMGQYVIRLLTDQDYFGDRLPRIPVLIQRAIALRCPPTVGLRKRR